MLTSFKSVIKSICSVTFISIFLLAGCGSGSESNVEENIPFTLDFTAKSAGETISCDTSHNHFTFQAQAFQSRSKLWLMYSKAE